MKSFYIIILSLVLFGTASAQQPRRSTAPKDTTGKAKKPNFFQRLLAEPEIGRKPTEKEEKLIKAILTDNLAEVTAICKRFLVEVDKASLLMLALQKGNPDIIKQLLRPVQTLSQIDVKIYTQKDPTIIYASPVAFAAGESPLEIVELLVADIRNDTLAYGGQKSLNDIAPELKLVNPLDAAAFNGRKDVFQYLLRRGLKLSEPATRKSSTLLWAAKGGSQDCIDECLRNQSDFFAKLGGWTMLHYYAQNGNDTGVQTCLDKGFYVDIAAQLRQGDEVTDHQTPLMLAAQNGRLSTCKLLMLYGADPLLRNAANKTSITLAHEKNFKEVEKALQGREVTQIPKTWNDLYTTARTAFLDGQYIIANSLANAALRKAVLPTDKTQPNYLNLHRLLADTYEQIALFGKGERYGTTYLDLIEKRFGNTGKEYVTAMLRLSDFYNKTAHYDKSRLILEVLLDKANRKKIKKELAYPTLAGFGAYYAAIGAQGKANTWFTAYFATKDTLAKTSYEELMPMLTVFQETKSVGGADAGNNPGNLLTGLVSLLVEGMLKPQMNALFSDEGVEGIKEKLVKEGRAKDTTALNTGQKVISKVVSQKDFDESAAMGGRAIANMLTPYINIFTDTFGEGTVSLFTPARTESLAEAVKANDGPYSQRYLSALLMQNFAYLRAKDSINIAKTTKLIQDTQRKIREINFERGLVYFPPTIQNIAPFRNRLATKEGLDSLKNYRVSLIKTYGKLHPLYQLVLENIAQKAAILTPNSLLGQQAANELNFIKSVLITDFTPPSLNASTYLDMLPEIEARRNGLKSFLFNWTRKDSVAFSFLYDFVVNDKDRLLFSLVESKRRSNPEYLFETGMYQDLRRLSNDEENDSYFFTSRSAKSIWDNADATMQAAIDKGVTGNESQKPQPYVWRQIQATLKPGQAAVEYFYLDKSKSNPDSVGIDYYALLIKPGKPQPALIYLFTESQLKPQIAYTAFDVQQRIEEIYRGGIVQAQAGKPTPKSESAKLYQLCWAPIQKQLNKTDTTIFYAPSGLLHKVSFAAISTPTIPQAFLGVAYRLNCLTSTQNLLEPSTTLLTSVSTTAALFGNPPTKQLSLLPGATEEIKAMKQFLDTRQATVSVFEGENATEAKFKEIGTQNRSPRLVVVSAHGAYSSSTRSSNPLLKSVLLLANADADTATLNSLAATDTNEGILTANEISSLNFGNTQLVVLSACSSGLGDVAGEEGVFGLQRAFKEAGAEYVLVSLWPVPDKPTAEMMKLFFENMVNRNQPVPEAFLNAQRAMSRNKTYKTYDWGAFVLIR